jgi:hypothetical protein
MTGQIPCVYGFTRGYSPKNKELCNALLDDAFHSPVCEAVVLTYISCTDPSQNLVQPDKYQFHHDIITEGIRLCWFQLRGKSFGFKHANNFDPMPIGVIAFLCTIVSR